jgi:hypothetical protein
MECTMKYLIIIVLLLLVAIQTSINIKNKIQIGMLWTNSEYCLDTFDRMEVPSLSEISPYVE